MKKNYRLHYVYINGYRPADRTRNYLCFTLIEPNKNGTKTLAVDEDVYNDIMRKCKDDAQRDYLAGEIHARILRRIQEGHHEGSINVAV